LITSHRQAVSLNACEQSASHNDANLRATPLAAASFAMEVIFSPFGDELRPAVCALSGTFSAASAKLCEAAGDAERCNPGWTYALRFGLCGSGRSQICLPRTWCEGV